MSQHEDESFASRPMCFFKKLDDRYELMLIVSDIVDDYDMIVLDENVK